MYEWNIIKIGDEVNFNNFNDDKFDHQEEIIIRFLQESGLMYLTDYKKY